MIARRRRHEREDRGFTLIEISITLVLMSLTTFSAYQMIDGAATRVRESDDRSRVQNTVRTTLDALTRDLRQSSTGRADLSRVEVSTGDSLTFYSPDDSVPNVHLRRIEYRVLDGALERRTTMSANAVDDPWAGRETWTWSTPGAWVSLVSGVTTPSIFSYRAASGAATTDPQAVQAIAVALSVDEDPGRPPGPQSYQIQIDIRGPS
jgi:prepilin-type N-terminal cleavage/methylation domain-containing protein